MVDLGKKTARPENQIVEGWEAIASLAGYSVSSVKNFEKQGMIVHRVSRGKKKDVWAYTRDIHEFVTAHDEKKGVAHIIVPDEKNATDEDSVAVGTGLEDNKADTREPAVQPTETVPQTKRWVWLWPSVIAMVLIGVLIVVKMHRVAPIQNPADHAVTRDLGYYQWEKSDDGLPLRLNLYDRSGHLVRKLWEVPSGLDKQDLLDFESVGAGRVLAERQATDTRPAMLLDCISGHPFIHTIESKEPLRLPDLSVATLEPMLYDKVYIVRGCFRIDDASFHGWALLAHDLAFFPSCLVLLDDDFEERARLYHPGRMYDLSQKGEWLFIATVLNARATKENLYRQALFKVSLKDLLGRVCQVAPYSPKTIPSLERRNYFRFKDIPEYQPAVYLALPPSSLFNFSLMANEGQIRFLSNHDSRVRIELVFSWDLKMVDKRVDERAYTGDFEKDYYATRFQYWQGDHWGPWQAETPP